MLSKEEFVETNKERIALMYFDSIDVTKDELINSLYNDYILAQGFKEAKAGDKVSEAIPLINTYNVVLDTIATISREYVTVNGKLVYPDSDLDVVIKIKAIDITKHLANHRSKLI